MANRNNPARFALWVLEASLILTVSQLADATTKTVPGEFQFYAKLTIFLLVAFFICVIEWRFWQSLVQRLHYQWKIIEWTGISRAFPVRGNPDGTDRGTLNSAQKEMAAAAVQEIAGTADTLDLLLASGWYYIGNLKNPGVLYNALANRKPPFKLTVLLLNPSSKEVAQRAGIVQPVIDSYRNEIQATLWTLAQWQKARNLEIKVALYEEEPTWQMIITQKELWLLCARQMAADEAPVYCIHRNGKYSLAWGMLDVWNRTWSKATVVDLATVVEPDWNKVTETPQPQKQVA